MRTLEHTLALEDRHAVPQESALYVILSRGYVGTARNASIVRELRNRAQYSWFRLPEGVSAEHHDWEYNAADNTLRVYSVDDSADRPANAPHDQNILAGNLSVDATHGVLAEGFRNRIWLAYMKGLGQGRFNTPLHHQTARDVANAIVDLFYRSTSEMVDELGIEEPQVSQISDSSGSVANFPAQRSAAVLTIATRYAADSQCSPDRAVELVRANAHTGR